MILQVSSLPYTLQKQAFRIRLGNLVQSATELFNEAGDILLLVTLYRWRRITLSHFI